MESSRAAHPAPASSLLQNYLPDLEATTVVEPVASTGPGERFFVSFTAPLRRSRHVFPLGEISGLARFTACHRLEAFWMRPTAGTRVAEVPVETQSLLVQLDGGGWLLLVPLVSGVFRFSLRGTTSGQLELLAETGDAHTAGLGGLGLYVAAGTDPFALVAEGARTVADRLGTSRLRVEKPLPDFVDSFGWCTWDAFYFDVDADKVRSGLEAFAAGGVRPRLLILDDGWLTKRRQPTGEERLAGFAPKETFGRELGAFVREVKADFGVKQFLVWHAFNGYWGGVDGAALPGYGVIDQPRHFGEGLLACQPSMNHEYWGSLAGLVPAPQVARFYHDFHGYLRTQGVDGVKVDNQGMLESMAQGQGGRIALTKAYRAALEGSVQRHFDGRLINCMSNAQETYYGSPDSTLIRTSIDFWPLKPETHGLHLYTNAQVGLWFGEFMHPDWDMFQSRHVWGAFHAAGRAVSGGPVYVSDKPGHHDFALLKKLVCSDGSVLRCDLPGRPTLDCLCVDPTREDVLLKIWNRAGAAHAGVVGVFNARHTPVASAEVAAAPLATAGVRLRGTTGPEDVPGLAGSGAGAPKMFAAFAHRAGTLTLVQASARMTVELGENEFEIFTFVPVLAGFAPIGLAHAFNSAAAIASLDWIDPGTCELALRDGGEFLAWSERAPVAVRGGDSALPFTYDAASGSVRVSLPHPGAQRLVLSW